MDTRTRPNPLVALSLGAALAVTACLGSSSVPGDEWGDPGAMNNKPKLTNSDGGSGDTLDGSGGDFRPADGRADAATDAAADARTDGGSSGDNRDGSTVADGPRLDGATDNGAAATPCEACTNLICRHYTATPGAPVLDLLDICANGIPGARDRTIGTGPHPNELFSTACTALVDCLKAQLLADPHADPYLNGYCGTASGTDCLVDRKPNGACHTQVEDAFGDTSANKIGSNFYELAQDPTTGMPTNALGLAGTIVGTCFVTYCPPACGIDSCTGAANEDLCKTADCKNAGKCYKGEDCAGAAGTCDPKFCVASGACDGAWCVSNGFCNASDLPDASSEAGGADAAAGGPNANNDTAVPHDAAPAVEAAAADAPGEVPAPETGTSGQGQTTWVSTAACLKCEADGIALGPDNGGCEPDAGCDKLVEPAKSLCLAAVNCMHRTACWTSGDIFKGCYCGMVANDSDCLTAPQGPCRAELEAAAPGQQQPSDVSTGFFDTTGSNPVALGFADKLIECDATDNCTSCLDNGAAQTGDGGAGGGGGGAGGGGGGGAGGSTGGGGNGAGGAGTGGSGSGGAGSGGAGSAGSDGQIGGAGSSDGADTSACPDLDSDGIADCVETLVTNATFNHDAAGWKAEFAASQLFDSHDAEGAAASGSLAVTNSSNSNGPGNLAITGSSQCVAASAGVT